MLLHVCVFFFPKGQFICNLILHGMSERNSNKWCALLGLFWLVEGQCRKFSDLWYLLLMLQVLFIHWLQVAEGISLFYFGAANSLVVAQHNEKGRPCGTLICVMKWASLGCRWKALKVIADLGKSKIKINMGIPSVSVLWTPQGIDMKGQWLVWGS